MKVAKMVSWKYINNGKSLVLQRDKVLIDWFTQAQPHLP